MIDGMGIKTAITPDDLIHMPRPENGKHYELSQGELIVVGNAGMQHEWVKRVILKVLFAYEQSHPGDGSVFSESQFMIGEGARIPDVALVKPGKLARWENANRAIPFAPDIAIEVISECRNSRVIRD